MVGREGEMGVREIRPGMRERSTGSEQGMRGEARVRESEQGIIGETRCERVRVDYNRWNCLEGTLP